MSLTPPPRSAQTIIVRDRAIARTALTTFAAALLASVGTLGLVDAFARHAQSSSTQVASSLAGSTAASPSSAGSSSSGSTQSQASSASPLVASSSSSAVARTGGS